jgi:hypothetical protein
MSYKTIDKVTKGKLSLILNKGYFIRVKFDRSVLEPNSSGTLLSFFSPFGKKIDFVWKVKNNKIEISDHSGYRSFMVDAHTEYGIRIYLRGDRYYVTFSGVCKNHFKKMYTGRRSFLQRFVKGPTISKLGQKIYYSHEVQ